MQSQVLHIDGSPGGAEAQVVIQWIRNAGLEVAASDNVYVGLARAMKAAEREFCAVVVCIEQLSADDFEFFSLLSRLRRDLPVFVYGGRHPDRIVRALQSGAKGLATFEAFSALGLRTQRRSQSELTPIASHAFSEVSVEPPKVGLGDSTTATKVSPPSEKAAESFDSKSGEKLSNEDSGDEPAGGIESELPLDGGENDQASAARVPWLRYQGGPARQGPAAMKAQQPAQAESQCSSNEALSASQVNGENGEAASLHTVANEKRKAQAAPLVSLSKEEHISVPRQCEPEYEPLLTEQELAALLGDDLDEVSFQERQLLAGDRDVPGGGTNARN